MRSSTRSTSSHAHEPVLLVFEDAHWADPSSLEWLGRVLERMAHLRLLVVVTFRPEFAPPGADGPA